jgi:N-acylneuraminate cytidylyltransferase
MSKQYAFIPARAGSKRIQNKNLIDLNGHPLIAYTINCARQAGIFEEIIVSTDSAEIAKISKEYGACNYSLRPESISGSLSPDIDWLNFELGLRNFNGEDLIAILRPTNPLRTAHSIIRAIEIFKEHPEVDSLRAIKPVKEHPSKMWRYSHDNLEIIAFDRNINIVTRTYNHSSPLQTLETLYVQDASLEITTVRSVEKNSSISGIRTIGFQMPSYEGFDINFPEDLEYLKYLLAKGIINLPVARKHLNSIE